MTTAKPTSLVPFSRRHIGPSPDDILEMCKVIGRSSIDELIDAAVPGNIRMRQPLDLPPPSSEEEALDELERMMGRNRVLKSFIGMGYNDCHVPGVIKRNILENPGWYTQYTPYQAEIAQGRLEALLNFQTMIASLTGLPVANASLLDEATAAAEAMALAFAVRKNKDTRAFLVDAGCHPQTIEVLQTRAEPLGIVCVLRSAGSPLPREAIFGAVAQYPNTEGLIPDVAPWIEQVHGAGALAILACDILGLVVLRPPGSLGADIAIGSAQRFGVPMGYGGPHAAFFATRDEFKRHMPGRLVGVSRDADGRAAYRLSLQTREQHIRREKATSNICTAQVLLAVMASMYAVYHGPEGLRALALKAHELARRAAAGIRAAGHEIMHAAFFDTICVQLRGATAGEIARRAVERGLNIRMLDEGRVCVAVDETTTEAQLAALVESFDAGGRRDLGSGAAEAGAPLFALREDEMLVHPVFHSHRTETEMLRYIRRLETRDLSLTTSMIPLGSCTMKLNASSEMFPVSWPCVEAMHPFAPDDQAEGYAEMSGQLERWLAEITGFAAVSLQPNAGSQGEYAGLLAIRGWHKSRGEGHRDVCLIPASAHGTNPASAVMAGYRVVPVACDAQGNIDSADLESKAAAHAANLAALMITYPSTHGVFETQIKEYCQIVHTSGGQVYMDGANLNAQVGLCRPGGIGADVCHLNLHKTFCIPHGGGGPGMGPIAVAEHLAPFLPRHPLSGKGAAGAVSAAPLGSASILVISWMYICMMGAAGLTEAAKVAILNANYVAARLERFFPVLFRGASGVVAHECIVDCRAFKESAGIEVDDIAKRLMDYGFHAPTMSWPVAGTMMIEPTESEPRPELDRFCEAMIAIHGEIVAVGEGRADRADNLLKRAPHTAAAVVGEAWERPYSREVAAFPLPWVRERKFWPYAARIDNVFGDRNLVCTCPPVDS